MSEYKLPEILSTEEKLELARQLHNRDKKIDDLAQELYELKIKLKKLEESK